MCIVLALAACGGEASVDPGLSTAQLQLPHVGRAVRSSLDLEPLAGKKLFDVIEVEGTSVRLRAGLCAEGESGFVVDWQEVKSWEDAGTAVGDDRFLGLPGYEGGDENER